MSRKVLMVAYHFPPLRGSSGIQRTLRFVRYLPEFGWEPIVLSVHPRAYESVSDDLMSEIPAGVKVIRATAFNAARHFSIAGRYPRFMALPDRWLSWWLGGTIAGMSAIREYAPSAIWSTYPIATAHMIGCSLQKRSGLPWVADFRDPMAQEGYPEDPATMRSFQRVERDAFVRSTFSTMTTPSAVSMYRERYPERENAMVLLENGFDEETFKNIPLGDQGSLNADKFTLLHSGIVYPSERDPTALFGALALLRDEDADVFAKIRIRFRAAVHDDLLRDLALRFNVESAIEILPAVAYQDALSEMMQADALLVLQAANCNAQVPAKLYEYFRAGRPIVALTDSAGDTASVCRAYGLGCLAQWDDSADIKRVIRLVFSGADGFVVEPCRVSEASRRGRTQQLAGLLDRAVGSQG